MTTEDIIAHWRKGAHDALEIAQHAYETAKYELALFHCHLAIEKALKAQYMEDHGEEAPYVHDLLQLALLTRRDWTEKQKRDFSELTDYVIAARYSDPEWAVEQATQENAARWVETTKKFLSSFLP